MPWKGEKDPYKIWLSEVILQQTRVQQGLAYYEKFISTFPNIQALADSPDVMVYKLWEGLGYYSRCKNLIFTARQIAAEGKFPDTYTGLLKLKGVGPYTAAAIASFAFDLPHAVVDGNVFRVLSRFFGESIPIDSTKGKVFFNQLAGKLLFQHDPASYNQAIMDFGATVCTPQIPLCDECPLRVKCVALRQGIVHVLPIKEKQLKKVTRYFNYFVFIHEKSLLIKHRKEKGIWQNLHEFVLVETEAVTVWKKPAIRLFIKKCNQQSKWKVVSVSDDYKQLLTHQVLHGKFIVVKFFDSLNVLPGYEKVPIGKLDELAFPKMITSYLANMRAEMLQPFNYG